MQSIGCGHKLIDSAMMHVDFSSFEPSSISVAMEVLGKNEPPPLENLELDAAVQNLETFLLTNQFIQSRQELENLDNLIDQFHLLDTAIYPVDERLFAHIHGDSFVGKTDVEGINFSKAVSYLLQFLKGFNLEKLGRPSQFVIEKIDEVVENLEFISNWCEKINQIKTNGNYFKKMEATHLLSDEIIEKIKRLSIGEKLILPGGWTEVAGGHTLIYEIRKQGNGKFTFVIYNTGEGTSFFHSKIKEADKEKIDPIFKLMDIHEENLCSPELFNALLEMQIFKESKAQIRYDYSAEDVYQLVASFTKGEQDNSDAEQRFITAQRAGTCSWRCLMAYLSSALSDKDIYKRLNFHIRLQALIDHLNNLKWTPKEHLLVNFGTEVFIKESLKLFQNSQITLTELLQAYATAKKSIAFLSSKVVEEKPSADITFNHALKQPFKFLEKFEQIPSLLEVNLLYQEKAFPIELLKLRNLTSMKAENVGQILQDLRDVCQKLYEDHQEPLLDWLIKKVVLALPIPQPHVNETFWNKLESPQKEMVMSCLLECSHLLFKACFHLPLQDRRTPEQALIIYKSYVIMGYLMSLMPEKESKLAPNMQVVGNVMEYSGFFEGVSGYSTMIDHRYVEQYLKLQEVFDGNESESITYFQLCGEPDYTFVLEDNSSDKGSQYLLNCLKDKDVVAKFNAEFPSQAESSDIKKAGWILTHIKACVSRNIVPNCYYLLLNQYFISKYFFTNADFSILDGYNPKSKHELNFKFESLPAGEGQSEVRVILSGIDILYFKPFEIYSIFVSNSERVRKRQFVLPHQMPITHEGIRKVFDWEDKNAYFDEDKFMSAEPLEGLTEAQSKRYQWIHANQNLSRIEMVATFYHEIDLMEDLDNQAYLYYHLFDAGLEKTLIDYPLFARKLSQFAKKGFFHYKTVGKLEVMLFFLTLSRHLGERFSKEMKKKLSLLDLQEEMRALLLVYNDPVQVASILAHLIACSHQGTIESVRAWKIIYDFNYFNKYSQLENLRNPYLVREIRESLFLSSQSVLSELEAFSEASKKEQYLNENVNRVYALFGDQEYKWKGAFPCFKVKNQEIYFNVLFENNFLNLIKEYSDFKEVFGENKVTIRFIKKALYAVEDDKEGQYVCFLQEDRSVIIQKMIQGKWMTYLSPRKLKNGFFIRAWDFTHTFWHSRKGEVPVILGINRIDGVIQYQFNSDAVLKLNKEGKPIAKLLNISGNKNDFDFRQLKQFEDETQILPWSDLSGDKPVSIELPRLQMTFKLVMGRKGRKRLAWLNDQFFISPNQSLPALFTFSNYLKLEDDRGNQKVLIPRWPLRTLPFGSLNTIVKHDREGEDDHHIRTLTFSLDKNGKLLSDIYENRLYLVYLFLGLKQFEIAYDYLKKCKKGDVYKPQENQLMNWIHVCREREVNYHPKALALDLHVAAYQFENHRKYGEGNGSFVNEEIEKELINVFFSYKNNKNGAASLRISREQEKLIIEELDIENSYLEVKNSDRRFFASHFLSDFLQNFEAIYKLNPKINLSALPFLNPQEYFARFFLSFYKIALVGNDREKVALKRRLIVRKKNLQSEEVNNNLDRILQIVLHSPDKKVFPSVKKMKDALKDLKNGNILSFEYILDEFNELFSSGILNIETIEESVTSQYVASEDLAPKASFESSVRVHKRKRKVEDVKGLETKVRRVFDETMDILIDPMMLDDVFDPRILKPALEKAHFDSQFSRLSYDLLKSCVKREIVKPEIPPQVFLEELQAVFSEPTGDRVIDAELERVRQEVFIDYVNRGNEIDFYRNLNSSKLEKLVKGILKEITPEVLSLEEEIVLLGNHLPKQKPWQATVVHLTQLFAKQKKVLSLDDLIILFLQNDPEKYQEANPHLDEQSVDNLKKKLFQYLSLAIEKQRMEKILGSIEQREMTQDQSEKQQLDQLIGKEIYWERAFNQFEHPEYLIFEYYSGMKIRHDQNHLLGKFESSVQFPFIAQLIMGGGKSKLLLPILAIKNAKKGRISASMQPPAQYEQYKEDIRVLTESIFERRIETLIEGNLTIKRLKTIVQLLNETAEKGLHLVIKDQAAHLLHLKWRQTWNQRLYHRDNKKLKIQLDLFKKILNKLKKKTTLVVDEADTVLNIRHEKSISLGRPVAIATEKMDLINLLFEVIQADSHLQGLLGLSTGDEGKFQRASYEANEHDVKTYLANTVLKKTLKDFPKLKLPEEETQEWHVLIQYLCGSTEIKRIPLFIKEFGKEEIALLEPFRKCLKSYIPICLSQNLDENYGFSKMDNSIPFVIPYLKSNIPLEKSQFCNYYETMICSFLAYLKKGVSYEQLEEMVKVLIKEANSQVQIEKISLDKTSAYTLFQSLGLIENKTLFTVTKADLQVALKKFNEDPYKILNFVRQCVLPKIPVYKKKLRSNPQHLVDMFDVVSGFTGTLSNDKTYHYRLSSQHALGTDGKTINILWEKSRKDIHVLETEEIGSDYKKIVSEILRNFSSCSSIIDVGALFKGCSNDDVAKAILDFFVDKPEVKGVVFYNKYNEQVILEQGKVNAIKLSESSLSPSERIVFLGQAHATGSDVKKPPDGVGLVTIGKNTTLRDLLQGVWRMRELDKNQRVKIFVPKYIVDQMSRKGLIKGNLLGAILRFVTLNQAEQQKEDHYLGFQQKILNLFEQAAFNVLLNEDLTDEDEEIELYKQLENLFVLVVEDDLGEWGKIEKEQPVEEALHSFIRFCIGKISKALTNPAYLKYLQAQILPWLEKYGLEDQLAQLPLDKALMLIVEKEKVFFSETVSTQGDDSMGMNQQVYQNEVKEVTQQTQMVQHTHSDDKFIQYLWNTEYPYLLENADAPHSFTKLKPVIGLKLDDKFAHVYTINAFIEMSKDEHLKKLASGLFSPQVCASNNVYRAEKTFFMLPWEGPQRIVKRVMIKKNMLTNEISLLRLTYHDISSLCVLFDIEKHRNAHAKIEPHISVILVDRDLGVIYSTEPADADNEQLLESPPFLNLLVQNKFIDGEIYYNELEIKALENWLKNKNMDDVEELLKNYILVQYPEKLQNYPESPLFQVINGIRSKT